MKKLLLLSCAAVFLTACGGTDTPDLSTNVFENPETAQTAVLKTNMGDIEMQLFHDKAPTMAKNFVILSEKDKYDNTIFHRVIKGFMIQGGDFQNYNGTGGKSYTGGYLEDEIDSSLSHKRGMVSMANRGPNTNGSQFFIVHKDSQFLDGDYSIFGQVISGMDVVDAIANQKTNTNDRPLKDVVIKDVVLK